MRILAIESSAAPASCCLWEDGRILARAGQNGGMTHSQTLLPMCEQLLRQTGLSVADTDYIAVAAGPGSFTGIRIGVAAVKGLAFADTVPCIPVSTLAAMARLTDGLPLNGTVCALMDARCGQVYTARFSLTNGELCRLTEDEAVAAADVAAALQQEKKPILLLGDGAEMCYTMWKDTLPGLYLLPKEQRYQDAVGVAAEAAHRLSDAVPPEQLLPHYLRLPQAERELRARQGADRPR